MLLVAHRRAPSPAWSSAPSTAASRSRPPVVIPLALGAVGGRHRQRGGGRAEAGGGDTWSLLPPEVAGHASRVPHGLAAGLAVLGVAAGAHGPHRGPQRHARGRRGAFAAGIGVLVLFVLVCRLGAEPRADIHVLVEGADGAGWSWLKPSARGRTGASKSYGDLVALHPLDLTVPRRPARRARRPQRLGQVDVPAHGRRPARADRRRDRDRRRAGRHRSTPAPRRRSCPTTRCSTTTCRVREHLAYVAAPARRRRLASDDFDELLERVGLAAPRRRPARPLQPRPAPEDLDRARPRATVRAAAGRRAVRRPRRDRQAGAARAARRGARRRAPPSSSPPTTRTSSSGSTAASRCATARSSTTARPPRTTCCASSAA